LSWQKRRESEEEVRKLNEELERRVIERTAQLEAANQELGKEVIERRRAEESMRASEERFRQIAESIREVFWITSPDASQVLYVSPAYEEIWGLSCAILYEQPASFVDTVHPQDRKHILAKIERQQRGQAAFAEYRIVRPDGSIGWIWDRAFPIRDERGEVYRVAGIAEDVTDRKQVEEALRNSEALYHSLVESLPQNVFRKDLDGRFTFANRRFCGTLGRTLEQIIGKTDFDIHPPELAEKYRQDDRRVIETEETFEMVEAHRALGGETIYVQVVKAPTYDSEGRVIGMQGIFWDVTDRKRAEEEMRNALATERELSELKSRFISMASHDFRTPLTAILSSAELLEHYNHKLAEEKRLHHLHRIQASVKNMTHLLEDVLIIGKAEAGKLEFNPESLDLERFCRDLVEEIQLSAGAKHTISFAGPSESASACMDTKLLRHILTNLLSNAIKYSPQADAVQFGLSLREDEAVFQIADRGIGIPPEARGRLYETFHRARNVGNIPGTGLGMAIVKKSVDLHGGTITFTSEIGAGTTFTVCLPLCSSAAQEKDK
jgi:PAS domain S-box-containing protein